LALFCSSTNHFRVTFKKGKMGPTFCWAFCADANRFRGCVLAVSLH
jgi:hypothetical protein